MPETTVEDGYYENERPEIARLVPSSARTILDVGCGKGRLGALLKQGAEGRSVYGIEYVPTIAHEAERVLDGVLVGDLQTMPVTFPGKFFDCMIFADVLEHLVDPRAVLQKLAPHLTDNGIILCSIPNVRHYTALMRVIFHGWSYDDFGLFDRTHLRFFSRGSMIQLVAESGFSVIRCEPRIVASRKMLLANMCAFGKLEEFIAMQYLIVARPNTDS